MIHECLLNRTNFGITEDHFKCEKKNQFTFSAVKNFFITNFYNRYHEIIFIDFL